MLRSFLFTALALFTIHCSLFTAAAQQRDYLTSEEIEVVRDVQELDLRMEVLVHAIDRRLVVLKIDPGTPQKKEKEAWGALPSGTRAQLLDDVRQLLQKAIDDIDNLSLRPDSMVVDPDAAKDKKKVKGFNDIFPKAVRTLAAAASRYQPILKTEIDKTTDKMEQGILMDAIDKCDQIVAASAKLPAITKK